MTNTDAAATMQHIFNTIIMVCPSFQLYEKLALVSKEIRQLIINAMGGNISVREIDFVPIKPQYPRWYRSTNALAMVPWFPHILMKVDNVVILNNRSVFCPALQQYALLENEYIMHENKVFYLTDCSVVLFERNGNEAEVESIHLADKEEYEMRDFMLTFNKHTCNYVFSRATRNAYIDNSRIFSLWENQNNTPAFMCTEHNIPSNVTHHLTNRGKVPVADRMTHNVLVEVVRPWLCCPDDYMVVLMQEHREKITMYFGYVRDLTIRWSRMRHTPKWLHDCSTFTCFYKNGVAYFMFEEGVIRIGHSLFF